MKWNVFPGALCTLVAVLLFSFGCSDDGVSQTARVTDDIPTNFSAATGNDSGEINLTWSPVDGVDGYMLVRSDLPAGTFDTIAALVVDTQYVDVVPADGRRYYYKVMSVHDDGSTSFGSSVVNAVGYFITIDRDTIHRIGRDTVESVFSSQTASLDTIVTTLRYQWTSDTVIEKTDSLAGAVLLGSASRVLEISLDSVEIYRFVDTLGITNDTISMLDTVHHLCYDTFVTLDTSMIASDDTVVTARGFQIIEDSTLFATTWFDRGIVFNTEIAIGSVTIDTVLLFTVADTLGVTVDTSLVSWPSVITLSADNGVSDSTITLTWLNYGSGFVYDLYVIRPNITYNDSVYVLLDSGLVANTFSDTGALPSYQTYKLVVRHPQLTGSREATAIGYRLVSDLEFWIEFNNTILKSQSKLTLMHKSGLSAVGDETIAGDSSGSVAYNATGGLGGATATLDYTNYRDFHLTLDGTQYTDISNVFSQTGTVKDSIFVTGLYPGKVRYDLTVSGGDPNGGYYYVTQPGKPEATINFSDVSSYVPTDLSGNPYH